MKYLKYHQEYKLENIKVDIDTSEMISESFENDITWGGSLLGRLINSTIRRFKIGYNQTKVDSLIKKLESELDYLVSSSLQGKNSDDFNKLMVIKFMEEIKDICLQPENVLDEIKLDELLGGHRGLYDATDPKKNQKTNGVIQGAINKITNDLPKEMKEVLGFQKKELLDRLSDFSDELRKLTLSLPNSSTQAASAGSSNFNVNFTNVLTTIKANQLITSGYKFGGVLNYELFLEMENSAKQRRRSKEYFAKQRGQETTQTGDKKPVENETEKPVENKEENPTEEKVPVTKGNPEEISKPVELSTETPQDKKETEPTKQEPNTEPNTEEEVEESEIKVGDEFLYTNSKGVTGKVKVISLTNVKTIGGDKEYLTKDDGTGNKLEPGQVSVAFMDKGGKYSTTSTNAVNKSDLKPIPRKRSEIDEVIAILKRSTEDEAKKNTKVRNMMNKVVALPKDKVEVVEDPVKYDDEEIKLAVAIDKVKSAINESMIYEISSLGDQEEEDEDESEDKEKSTPETGGGSSKDDIKKENVKGIWEKWFAESDRKTPHRLTQREVDEVDTLLKNGLGELKLDVAKRPDPIIAIGRIYGRAHELYFTPVIPSGRPGGKVSQKTYREYVKLGAAPSGAPADGSYGPWAVKSILNKWTDGVMKLLQNQEYRKILANVNFVVVGSEDQFNKTTEGRIYEAETATDPIPDEKSHGRILFQFMNDMLDKNKLDDFDTLRSTLLAKYFGLKTKIKPTTPTIKPINNENKAPNCFLWQEFPKRSLSKDEKNQFFAIPINRDDIKSNEKHDIIFAHILGTEDDAFRIKFTFDRQLIANKYKETKYPKDEMDDISVAQGTSKNIYYGLISKNTTGTVTLVYGNVGNGGDVKEIYGTAEVRISKGTKKTLKGERFISVSKLIRNGQDGNPDPKDGINDPFEVNIASEKKQHTSNFSETVKGTSDRLIDALKKKYAELRPKK